MLLGVDRSHGNVVSNHITDPLAPEQLSAGGCQYLFVLDQRHTEEVRNSSRTPEALFLIEMNCPVERRCGIERDP